MRAAFTLLLAMAGMLIQPAAAAENYIPGALDTPSSLPLYLNAPDMYYPDASGGLCWASANAGVFAYWDRNAYNGVKYWNLVDNGTAPLREPVLPNAPGHGQGDVKSVVAWLAHQYYGLLRRDEDAILREFANDLNGLSFVISSHGPAETTADKTTLFNTIKVEIDAGRPLSAGAWGMYFGGPHQVPIMGYKEMYNTVDSTVYIHRNLGGTQSEYVNFFSSTWGDLDMNTMVPGGIPTDHYEAMGDSTPDTAVTIEPDQVYNFRQTHNFSSAGDADWIKLNNAMIGRKYTITTLNLGASCDTVLQLYASDGTTLLAQDDDGGGEDGASEIVWDSDVIGAVYIKVTEKSSRFGHAANYDVQVTHDGGGAPSVVDLQNGVAVSGLAGNAGASQHSCVLTVPEGAASLQISITGGSGDCDLYVRYGSKPTTSVYDYCPWLDGNSETVTVYNPPSGDWYVMLYGYEDYADVTLRAWYTLEGSGSFLCPAENDSVLSTVGTYDGYFYGQRPFGEETLPAVLGTLNVKVSNLSGRLTAKALMQSGSISFSGKLWSGQDEAGTLNARLNARGGETLDLYVRQNRIWGTLTGGRLGAETLNVEAARNRFADRKDAAAQTQLNVYKQYYTASLCGTCVSDGALAGSLAAVPLGDGYLTLAISGNGKARVAGILADGTRVSQSSQLLWFSDCGDYLCVPFFVPLYKRSGWIGGLIMVEPNTGELYSNSLANHFVRWEKPGAGPDGFNLLIDLYGSVYWRKPLLAELYLFDAYLDETICSYHHAGGVAAAPFEPTSVPVAGSGSRLKIARGNRPVKIREDGVTWYEYGGENPTMASLSFASSTGIFKGRYTLYYDYYDVKGRFQHKALRVPYAGVMLTDPWTGELSEGYGHCLFPANDPELKAYKIKPSFLVSLLVPDD